MGRWRRGFCLRSWLRINNAIKKHDYEIGLLNMPKFTKLWPWCVAFREERWRKRMEAWMGNFLMSTFNDVSSTTTTNDYILLYTQLEEAAVIHCESPQATPNCSCATSALSIWVCANSYSIGSTTAKRRWEVYRNVFLINHKRAFKISVQCGGEYFFLHSLREHLKHTRSLTANGSVVNHITHCRADLLFGPFSGACLVLPQPRRTQNTHIYCIVEFKHTHTNPPAEMSAKTSFPLLQTALTLLEAANGCSNMPPLLSSLVVWCEEEKSEEKKRWKPQLWRVSPLSLLCQNNEGHAKTRPN